MFIIIKKQVELQWKFYSASFYKIEQKIVDNLSQR